MARMNRTHVPGDVAMPDVASGDGTPSRHLTKYEFGRKLYQLMMRKGWNQAELARRSGVLRDGISTYVRGVAFPSPVSLHKLAAALGVKPEDLLPNYLETAIKDDEPSFEMKVSPGDPSTSWVRLNQRLSSDVAAQIAVLVHGNALNRK